MKSAAVLAVLFQNADGILMNSNSLSTSGAAMGVMQAQKFQYNKRQAKHEVTQREELLRKFITRGRTNKTESPLAFAEIDGDHTLVDQDGYERSLGVTPMRNFFGHVLQQQCLVADEGIDKTEFMKYYDGTCQKQTYPDLVREMHRSTEPGKCHDVWIHPAPTCVTSDVELLQQYMQEKRMESEWKQKKASHNVWPEPRPFEMTAPANIGETSPLTQIGYHMVAHYYGDTQQMTKFVRRTIEAEGLAVTLEKGLHGFVPWYSGECAIQSFPALVSELHVSVVRTEGCGGGWLKVVNPTLASKAMAALQEGANVSVSSNSTK